MQMEHNIVDRYKDGVVGFHKTNATVKNEAGQRTKNGSGESLLAWVAEGMSSLEGHVYGNEQFSWENSSWEGPAAGKGLEKWNQQR